MPRKPRVIVAGSIYHVVNRGNDKRVIFPQNVDYDRFVELLQQGRRRAPVSILGYCLMPTHFHMLLRPAECDALSTYMHWVTGSYACELRRRTDTLGFGHVFQRRFWAGGVHDEAAFIAVLRYVEANARRARLVTRAQHWKWTSLAERLIPAPGIIDPSPVTLPVDWCNWVNLEPDESVLERIRRDLRKVH